MKYYIAYNLEDGRSLTPLKSETASGAELEVSEALPDLLYLGASHITICDAKGVIVKKVEVKNEM